MQPRFVTVWTLAIVSIFAAALTAVATDNPSRRIDGGAGRAVAPMVAPAGVDGTYNNYDMINPCARQASRLIMTLSRPGLTANDVQDTFVGSFASGWTLTSLTAPQANSVAITWDASGANSIPAQGHGHFGYKLSSGAAATWVGVRWEWPTASGFGGCNVSSTVLSSWLAPNWTATPTNTSTPTDTPTPTPTMPPNSVPPLQIGLGSVGSSTRSSGEPSSQPAAVRPLHVEAVIGRVINPTDQVAWIQRYALEVADVVELSDLMPTNPAIIDDRNLIDRRGPIRLAGGQSIDHLFEPSDSAQAVILVYRVYLNDEPNLHWFGFTELLFFNDGDTRLPTAEPPNAPPPRWRTLLPLLFK